MDIESKCVTTNHYLSTMIYEELQERIEESIETYKFAESIEDIKRMNIAFLRGEMKATSYHLGPLNSESIPLVDKLIQLNELDYITTNSQPGGLFGCYYQRSYVSGILPRKHVSSFVNSMNAKCQFAFVKILEREMTREELQWLELEDLYWVTTRNGKNVTHISEITFACEDFRDCYDVYNDLVKEYVHVYVMDKRWGYTGTDILDTAIELLQEIKHLDIKE